LISHNLQQFAVTIFLAVNHNVVMVSCDGLQQSGPSNFEDFCFGSVSWSLSWKMAAKFLPFITCLQTCPEACLLLQTLLVAPSKTVSRVMSEVPWEHWMWSQPLQQNKYWCLA